MSDSTSIAEKMEGKVEFQMLTQDSSGFMVKSSVAPSVEMRPCKAALIEFMHSKAGIGLHIAFLVVTVILMAVLIGTGFMHGYETPQSPTYYILQVIRLSTIHSEVAN